MLYKAGADFGFISANTPHIPFDKVQELSSIQLLSIIDETRKHIEKTGIKVVYLEPNLQYSGFSKHVKYSDICSK